MPLLDVRSCTKQFGGLTAINNFNLGIEKGELVGLIGPNGAGKTTAFNLLTGVYPPTKGTIEFDGRSIAGLRPNKIAGRGIARTFQNIRLFTNLSVFDNVQCATRLHYDATILDSILRTQRFERAEAKASEYTSSLLERFGLLQSASALAKNLSYGQQRRLEIARALAAQPQLLLLDEPAAGMNPQEKRELMDQIQSIRADFNLTILLIEHDMKVVMGVCERLLVLDYGQVIAEGTPDEIRANPKVIEAYLGAPAEEADNANA